MVQRHVQERSQSHDLVTGRGHTANQLQRLRARIWGSANVSRTCPLDALALPNSDGQWESACPASSTAKSQQATRKTWTRARAWGPPRGTAALSQRSSKIRRQLRRTASRIKRDRGASGSTTVVAKPKVNCIIAETTDTDLRRKGAARGVRAHPRTTIRVGISGSDQVFSAEGQHGRTRMAQGLSTCWARLEPLLPNQISDKVGNCRLDKTYKADIKRITLNIVSPEKRLFVLEALVQTESERKYGRAPPTAMERELQDRGEGFLR